MHQHTCRAPSSRRCSEKPQRPRTSPSAFRIPRSACSVNQIPEPIASRITRTRVGQRSLPSLRALSTPELSTHRSVSFAGTKTETFSHRCLPQERKRRRFLKSLSGRGNHFGLSRLRASDCRVGGASVSQQLLSLGATRCCLEKRFDSQREFKRMGEVQAVGIG